MIPPFGHSVISAIADAIEITGILEGEATVLRNTFFREFFAAPCLAGMHQDSVRDVAFNHVPGRPWQMYGPLERFLFSTNGDYPCDNFNIKNRRTNPFEKEACEDVWMLVANGSEQTAVEQKLAQIRAVMAHVPWRTFMLIGDSDESDSKVFRQIRDEFSDQLRKIKIRTVSDPGSGSRNAWKA